MVTMTTERFRGRGGLRHTKIVGDFGEALESYRQDDKVKMFECDYQNIRWL